MQIRLAIYAAAATLICFLIWREHRATQRAAELRVEVQQANANLAALQAAWDHERKIAKDATDDYESRLQALSAARADTPTRSVRLCSSPTGWVPAAAAAAGAGPGDPAGREDDAGRDLEAGPDIGNDLYALADEWDKRAAQCNSLIRWVQSR